MVIQAVRHRIQRKNTVWNRQKHRNKELYRQMKTLLEACYWHFIQWWREKERYFFVYTEKLGIDLNKLEAGNITMDLLSFYYRSRENFEFFRRKIRFFLWIFLFLRITRIFSSIVWKSKMSSSALIPLLKKGQNGCDANMSIERIHFTGSKTNCVWNDQPALHL